MVTQKTARKIKLGTPSASCRGTLRQCYSFQLLPNPSINISQLLWSGLIKNQTSPLTGINFYQNPNPQDQPKMAATGSKALAILAIAAVAISCLSSVVVAAEAPAPTPTPESGAIAGAIASPLVAGIITSAVVLLLGSLRQ
ncbi:Arabinogalactan peptide 3 [Carex littledalei]|uniref:Arabinogalactan peptide 3 n=1 Tax=Carex littledalei TaxID=544730 RepID=A0A833QCW7_9POAL|nr:Arabinogalactan peptide 3 [Carex littledalei]